MRKFIRLAAICCLGSVSWFSAWGQPTTSQSVSDAQKVLDAPRRWIHKLVIEQATARKAVKDTCDGTLVAADEELLKTNLANTAEVSKRAQAALTEQERCDEAKDAQV